MYLLRLHNSTHNSWPAKEIKIMWESEKRRYELCLESLSTDLWASQEQGT
jgi:hypothetical protein